MVQEGEIMRDCIVALGKPSDSEVCQIKGCDSSKGLMCAATSRGTFVKLCRRHFKEAKAGIRLVVVPPKNIVTE